MANANSTNSHNRLTQPIKKNLRMKRIIFTTIISLFILTSVFAQYSGNCGAEGVGSHLTWTLDEQGVLTISGTGAMTDYGWIQIGEASYITAAPWGQYAPSLQSLVLNEGITHIGINAFLYCSGLTGSLTIPNSVETIGVQAFHGCRGLMGSLIIPNSIKTIGNQAFSHCNGFSGNLTIPNSVEAIGNYAFQNCSGLTGSLTIGNSVETIGDWAFLNCSGFTSIESKAVTPPTAMYDSFNGVNANISVYVPYGTVADYQAATGWDYFTNFIEAEIATFTITFNSNGGSDVAPIETEQGSTITAPAQPTKDGHTFVGWFKDESLTNEWDFAVDMVYGNTTLYAKWDEIIVILTVTFNSNGGSDVAPIETEQGNTITAPHPPTREGYTFAGWFKDESLAEEWSFATNAVTENITLYAKWNINTYTITFETNGGSTVNAIDADYGTFVAQPTTTKMEHTFAGWFVDEGFTTEWNFAINAVTVNITLYAKWNINTYTVTFRSNGGTAVPAQVVESGEMVTPVVSTRTNMTLEGWYTNETFTNKWYFATDVVSGDITLYAKWIDENSSINTNTLPAGVYSNGNGTFTVDVAGSKTFNVTVINISGQIVKRETVQGGNHTINIANQPAGVYMFVVESGKEKTTAKVIKR